MPWWTRIDRSSSPPTSRRAGSGRHRGAGEVAAGLGHSSPISTPRPTSCASASCRPWRNRPRHRCRGKVLEFLAHEDHTSMSASSKAPLHRISAHTQPAYRPRRSRCREGAQDVLRDLLRAEHRRVTIDEIQKRNAGALQHPPRRHAAFGAPRALARLSRQVAMYLRKQLTPRSPLEIGRKFGGRAPHHGHACGAQDRGAEGGSIPTLAERHSNCSAGCWRPEPASTPARILLTLCFRRRKRDSGARSGARRGDGFARLRMA